jgi:hypothetical protein
MLATKDEAPADKSEEIKNEEHSQESEISTEDNFSSELNAPLWAVVSFEKILKNNLTYDEALELMERSKEQKISGLCIITDEAAQRLTEQ